MLPRRQVIERDYRMTSREKRVVQVRSDEAGTACDECFQRLFPLVAA